MVDNTAPKRNRAYRARRTAKIARYEEALRKIATDFNWKARPAVEDWQLAALDAQIIARTALGETQ